VPFARPTGLPPTEANAVIGFCKILEEVKGCAALPRLQVDFLSTTNHNLFHTNMLKETR
jgi:hypothetical protein